ncbi:MAG TPA: hypothetical protein VFD58_13705 [Blastocatellia bacterium]|nr:hypothetical protein [Blastocatellia bacterium]
MDLFGLSPDRVAERVRSSGRDAVLPTLAQSLWIGSSGFCSASLLVFATVASGERWMYSNLGLPGAYATWTVIFILAGGAVLSPLVIGPGRVIRFYLLFSAAFLLYAAGWVGAYFTLGGVRGEWLGSFAGTALMGLVLAGAFGAGRDAPKLILSLFAANSVGYFLGEVCASRIQGKTGMLVWGACYGLGLGAGLGYALYRAQAPVRERLAR